MLDVLFVVLGLGLLMGGAEALVRGACGVALLARITPAVIGLTIVAAGTSMPELVVSVQAALAGNPGIAVGNVVGSNIFNIGAIIGIAALIHPLRIVGTTIRLEWPIMMLAAMAMTVLARDGAIDRLEGGFLAAGMVAFTAWAVWMGRHHASEGEQSQELTTASFGATGGRAVLYNVLALALGVGLLAGGSTLLVDGAVGIAHRFGISDTIIGLTIVAAGTSAPELVTSIVASRRGQDDIAITNVVGSNIFNILAILGPAALILPLEVPAEILARDVWWMLGFSLLLLPLMKTGLRVNRAEGGILLACFLGYTGMLVAHAMA